MNPGVRGAAVGIAGFCAFLNLYAPQSLLPLLAQEFGVGPADISLTMTATALAIAITAPFAGAIADVLGRKRVIVWAMLLLIVPTVMVALAPSFHALILARFALGLVLPPVFTVTVSYIGEEWPPAAATGVTGLYMSATGFGGFCGRLLAGVVADTVGWREAFFAIALLTAAGAIAVALYLPRERQFVRSEGLMVSGRQMLAHLRNPRLTAIYAVGFGTLFNFIAVFTYINFVLAAPPFNLSPAFLGAIFVTYLAGSIATTMLGRAVARFGRRPFIVAVIALWAAGAALTLLPSLAAIIAGLAICAACGFLTQAASTSLVAQVAQEGRTSALGLYATCFYVGGSVGAVLPGLAWNAAGWPAAVAMVIGVLAVMATVVWSTWKSAD